MNKDIKIAKSKKMIFLKLDHVSGQNSIYNFTYMYVYRKHLNNQNYNKTLCIIEKYE